MELEGILLGYTRKGYQVVGYDPSPLYIDKAREQACFEGLGSRATFYQGMMNSAYELLNRNCHTTFDAVIIMYNSIGYSGKQDDIRILKQLNKLAHKNTILVTETENLDWTVRNFVNHEHLNFQNIENPRELGYGP